jgi:hypothetical protein
MIVLSLTARLNLLFAACSAPVLLGFGWGVSRAVDGYLQAIERQEIEGKCHMTQVTSLPKPWESIAGRKHNDREDHGRSRQLADCADRVAMTIG